jgi:alkyldihydroxyacetonephosphate synthase
MASSSPPTTSPAGPAVAADSAALKEDAYQRIKWNGWGSKHAVMKVDEQDYSVVRHVNGKPIRGLIPFLHKEINGGDGPLPRLEATPGLTLDEALAKLPAAVVNDAFVAQLQKGLQASQIRLDGESRLTHLFGKNYRDLWRLRKGFFERAPDAVVLPQSHDDCVKLVEAAHKHNVVIIPFGGGTNVTGCVEPNPFDTARRMIVSIDMRRMTRMLSIDKESRVATFEVGVVGPDLDEQLGRHGFMFGHDPDSYIYSTLGGWIAARGSGAMSNKYGDIEQMVLSMKVVTPTGVIETPLTSRPCGVDLNGMFIGSEGIFGIITEAVVKVEPIPPVKLYEGYLFPSFEAGYSAFYKCTAKGIHPTCMRLYDEDDTRMSFAMKWDEPAYKTALSKAIKAYLTNVKGFKIEKMCLVILGFEGSRAEVNHQRDLTTPVFRQFDGFSVGQSAGAGWQEKKYDLPYIRDFALAHAHWADVFETSVMYAEAIPCWRAVKEAVRNVWKQHGKRGWIGCHAAHQYRFGCCLYFTFASAQKDDRDLEVFLKLKTAATEAILKHRGNLSHHHGIGFEHVPWMERYFGTPTLDLLLKFKKDVDPKNILNPGKVLPVAANPGESKAALAARRKEVQMFDKMGLPKGSKAPQAKL